MLVRQRGRKASFAKALLSTSKCIKCSKEVGVERGGLKERYADKGLDGTGGESATPKQSTR
jgi:hypothetical protein